MSIEKYIEQVNKRFKSGISKEHSYRGDLETLIRELVPGVEITNEPANVTDCGNPDYVITKGKIPIGYIEAKDIGKNLNSRIYEEQFTRYKKALDNLIITDYIWFQFFKNSELVYEIRIAEIEDNKIKPLPENFEQFTDLIKDFCTYIGQTIKSSKKLAKMMASKARLLQDILEKAITSDEETEENTSLREQYKTFKSILIHDLSPKAFADIYAQTLAYGMFAARLHDKTLDDFSRQEAAELIPKSNPFLRKLFGYVAGPDIDERIVRVVDNLAEVFRATNLEQLLKSFGKSTQTQDPIIHFYETFLAEYDPKLRKARGVWYTPEPVVNFIVRAVDEILKTEFNLPQGIADTSKTKIKVNTQNIDKRSATGYRQIEKEVHKVQILDPATGTGTFLAEVIKHIYYNKFKAMQGAWSNYVDEHLIPRLNGFELLMASYAMAHLKLDLLLQDTGYKPTKNQRFNIYLTNSLEEYHPDTGTLFASWLSSEANEANHIKRDTPVMVIMGNPPYSGESANNGKWINNLINLYKKDHNNQKIPDTKWLNNDYVKFLRYGQFFIEKNGEGILAYITDNSFLDSISFRGIRWNLLKTYDFLYILNLHGNSLKKETTPNGDKDENVFDIKQGVSISLFVKTRKKKKSKLGKVFYCDLYGKRENKYKFLLESNLNTVPYTKLPNVKPNYFFVKKDFSSQKEYNTFIKIDKLFNLNGVGICSKRDDTAIKFTKNELLNVLRDFTKLSKEELKTIYKTEKTESRDKKTFYATENILKYGIDNNVQKINYRPFDIRFTYFTNQSRGFLAYPVYAVMRHFTETNFGLIVSKKSRQLSLGYMFITNSIVDLHILDSAADSTYNFPLYLYPEQVTDSVLAEEGLTEKGRKPNLNTEMVNQIAKKLDLPFTPEKEEAEGTFAPIDILDYIYAVLHSPTYRKKYKEFLKIDFPRIPYPKDKNTFWRLVKLGSELRQIHLLESPKVEKFITSYPIDGDNIITTKIGKKDWEIINKEKQWGRIWINDKQYFDNIPLVAWNFYIGGYQPAQKWLKDRKGRTLSFEDILHYQKIIVALYETDKIMKEIDKIEIE